ncbi:Uncharacterised protein [Vibrio cholerae]|nr:Uncharacterised protein [Vibrio cholerae]
MQFTLLEHFQHDVTTANQLAFNPQLWKRWPLRVNRQLCTDVWVL